MADEDEDIDAKIRKAQDADKAAREARDKAEKTQLFGDHPEYFTAGAGFVMVPFPTSPAHLPGCIVARMPSKGEQQQFRETQIGQGSSVKARGFMELLDRCKVYPADAEYKALLQARPAFADAASVMLVNASQGAEKEAGKG